MAIHSSVLAWKIPQTEEPGGQQYVGRKESDTTEHIHAHTQILTLRKSTMSIKESLT